MKKKTTSTALVIPQSITPKPTKNNIINAMVERARVKHNQERGEYEAKRAKLKEKIDTAAMAELSRSPGTPQTKIRTWTGSERVEIEYTVKSPMLAKLIREYHDMPSPRHFDDVSVRRQIREGMSNQAGNAVQSLLANPDAVKALDASLEHIGM